MNKLKAQEDLFYDWLEDCPVSWFLEKGGEFDIKTDTIYYGFSIDVWHKATDIVK